jgi:hypothetical protein
MRRRILLAKLIILSIALPVIVYLWLCSAMSIHYSEELDRYDDAALSISDRWVDLQNFNQYSVCEADRLEMAGAAAIDHQPFDLWWMICNWNTDFLAQQKPCPAPPHTGAGGKK